MVAFSFRIPAHPLCRIRDGVRVRVGVRDRVVVWETVGIKNRVRVRKLHFGHQLFSIGILNLEIA